MKKVISVLLIMVMMLSLSACGSNTSSGTKKNSNETSYQEAKELLSNGHYERALTLFEELEKLKYKDSSQMVSEAKYQLVLKINDSEDATVYEYLKDLVADDYKDAESVFEQLYAWKFEIAFSTREGSTYHQETVKATKQIFPFYYINFRITGGEPGEKLHGQYEVLFSDGQKITKGYYDGNGTVLSIVLSATETPLGRTTFTLYDDYGNELAQQFAYIE